jgi:hypothetical protein
MISLFLFNTYMYWPILRLYNGKTNLLFEEIMMMFALYQEALERDQ